MGCGGGEEWFCVSCLKHYNVTKNAKCRIEICARLPNSLLSTRSRNSFVDITDIWVIRYLNCKCFAVGVERCYSLLRQKLHNANVHSSLSTGPQQMITAVPVEVHWQWNARMCQWWKNVPGPDCD